MKRILSLAIVVQLGWALPAAANVGPENNEGNTDAGSLPGDSQKTTGNGTISTIRGTLEGAAGVSGDVLDLEDMYLIRIDDPANFLATTVPALGGSADFDSRLFLFHADFGPEGLGILGNNDTFIPGLGKGEFSFGSTLTNQATDETGAEVTQAGLYYLAITVNPRGPISEGGQIFRFDFSSEISGPDGDGGDSVVIAWDEDLPPTGACCASDILECTIETQADCEKAFGTYQGDGTTCDPDPCAPVQGACCFGEFCSMQTEGSCLIEQGEYLGDGTDCSDAPCELGACCLEGGFLCEDLTEDDCIEGGGDYQGDSSDCGQEPCLGLTGPTTGEYVIYLNGVSFAVPPTILATLKIKQGACPAPVNPHSNGAVPMLLVGDTDFSVDSVIQETLELRRCDGEGGVATPMPDRFRIKDMNHPREGELACGECGCDEGGGQNPDGIPDLQLKFRTSEMLADLDLGIGGGTVTLELTGELTDGSIVVGRGCVVVVPPGSAVNNLVVQSNVSDTFVEVWPIDLNVDSDGFADFARSYVSSTVVDLRAPLFSEGRRFVRWNVSGVPQGFGVRTLSVRVTGDTHLEAVYRRSSRVGVRPVLEPSPVVD